MGWICFFFQAEDGIRDVAVTGVQTCALPILIAHGSTRRAEPPVPVTRHPRFNPASRSDTVTVHPPPNDRYCDLPMEPAPVRYSHGTREGRLTVAPFRAWRGSAIPVAWGPTFNAAP